MNITALRITVLWIIIVVCFALHGSYHVSQLTYGIDIKSSKATGTVPVAAHIVRIVFEAGLLIFALLTLHLTSVLFKKITFGFSILLAVVNVFHLYSTAMHDLSDYSQIAILSVLLSANILLVFSAKSWLKEK